MNAWPSFGDFGEPPFEKTAFRLLPREGERPFVRGSRILCPAKPAAEVGAGGVGQPVILKIAAIENLVDGVEPGLGTVSHADRDRSIQLDHG